MDLPPEVDDYIRESIEHSLNLPVSTETLRLKLLASDDARRRLQDRIFLLENRLQETNLRLEQSKAEATMNALGLKKCIEEKEVLGSRYADLANQCAKLEKECLLYDQDIERLMESCDELGKENEEVRTRLQDSANAAVLIAEIESLKRDKEHLRVNLVRAEEETNVLFEENSILDKENKWLLRKLNKEKNEGSDAKHNHETHPGSAPASKHPGSASGSAKGKRKHFLKSSFVETMIDFDGADSTRHPLSPLHQNSPDSRRHKK